MIPLLFKSGRTLDIDARRYIAAVESADGQSLETSVKRAINAFVVGCKSDGIWNAIEDCCLMLGARTLSGALVKLKGTGTVTNFNFVQADYDRKVGLKGNGSSKSLDTNRLCSAEPQDNQHVSVWLTEVGTSSFAQYIGAGISEGKATRVGRFTGSGLYFLSRSGVHTTVSGGTSTGFLGLRRNNSANFNARHSSVDVFFASTSNIPIEQNIMVFASRTEAGEITTYANSRMPFYSIGTDINLTLLNNRVATLVSAIGTAL